MLVAIADVTLTEADGSQVHIKRGERLHDHNHYLAKTYPEAWQQARGTATDNARALRMVERPLGEVARVSTPSGSTRTTTAPAPRPKSRGYGNCECDDCRERGRGAYSNRRSRRASSAPTAHLADTRSSYRVFMDGRVRAQLIHTFTSTSGRDHLEQLVFLTGRYSPALIYVSGVMPAPDAQRSRDSVDFDGGQLVRQATAAGRLVVGYAHSHIDTDAFLSASDKACIERLRQEFDLSRALAVVATQTAGAWSLRGWISSVSMDERSSADVVRQCGAL